MDTVGHEASQQLILLKSLTKETGLLHEAQVKQVQLWSMLAIEKATSFPEILFNFELKEITINFKKLKIKKTKEIENRLRNFTEWIHWLLGDEYLVRIKDDDGMIYRALRNQQLELIIPKKKDKRVLHEPKLFDGDLE